MSTVLTIAPLGGADMTRWCGGWATRQGEVIAVPSAANLTVNAIPDAALEVDKLVSSIPGPITLFAQSQGCQVVGQWLDEYGRHQTVRDIARVRAVLTGNLERQFFGYAARKPKWIPDGNIRRLTPNDTGHEVLDIGRQSDRFANSLYGLAALLAFWPHSGHLDYSGVNPDEIPEQYIVKEVGNTKYANVP